MFIKSKKVLGSKTIRIIFAFEEPYLVRLSISITVVKLSRIRVKHKG
jgi:hypothetical protein